MRDATSPFYLIEMDFGPPYGAAFYEARVETGDEVKRLIASGEIEKPKAIIAIDLRNGVASDMASFFAKRIAEDARAGKVTLPPCARAFCEFHGASVETARELFDVAAE